MDIYFRAIILTFIITIIMLIIGQLLATFILGVFLILLFLGIAKVFIMPYFQNRKISKLNDDHVLIYPQKQRVRVDTTKLVGGVNPYVIDCFYTDPKTGREFCFTSKEFPFDPSAYIASSPLLVFTNPDDYSNYYVDTSIIPEK